MTTTAAQPADATEPDATVAKDLKTLANFIELYCASNHAADARKTITLATHDVAKIAGREICVCPDCGKLLAHAFVKRSHCPMNPKPACKHCPKHCYHPKYRAAIAEVMRFSGRKMVMGGRLDYLLHLLF